MDKEFSEHQRVMVRTVIDESNQVLDKFRWLGDILPHDDTYSNEEEQE